MVFKLVINHFSLCVLLCCSTFVTAQQTRFNKAISKSAPSAIPSVDQEPVQNQFFTVNTLQDLSFGTFHAGMNGGRIYVLPNGERTAEGDIVLLHHGEPPRAATYEIRCEPYRMLHLHFSSNFGLSSNSGTSLSATPLGTDPGLPLVTPADAERGFLLQVGGVLIIPPGAQAGAYQGAFQVSMVYE